MDNNQGFSKTLDILIANTSIIEIVTIIIVVSCIIGIMIYVAIKQTDQDRKCNNLKNLYPNQTTIRPVSESSQLSYTIGESEYDTRLTDMYIKSSYNSCSAGNYKDDWVSTCALNEVLKQGCRFIDFEIYSIDHKPVVATSTTTDYYTKETWNSIPFDNVTKIIKNNAFSSDFVVNNTDPLIVHLRFKSNDILMYNNLADIIIKDLDTYTLDNKYNCRYTGKGSHPGNVLEATFNSNVLKQKVIFAVDGTSNVTYQDTSFNEFVNLSTSCTDKPNIVEKKLFTADNADSDDLIKISKHSEIIVLPDLNSSPVNIDCTSQSKGLFNSGCQIVAMCFQLKDKPLNNYIKFFDQPAIATPCAFILKDTSLIDRPVTTTYDMPDEMVTTHKTIVGPTGTTFKVATLVPAPED